MHIALISYEFPPMNAVGGIGSYMFHLAVFLGKNGNKVTVFSADPKSSEVLLYNELYYQNYSIPAKDNEDFRWLVVPVFDQFIKSNSVDVLESPEVGACAWYIKIKYPHIPLIVKMHTPGVLITKVSNTYLPLIDKIRFVAASLKRGKLDMGYWAKYDKNRDTDLEYKICMKADCLLSPSFALKNWAINFWNIPGEKIQVLPNPFNVDDELFDLPLYNRPMVISFIGKLSVLKGMRAFTEAIPMILEKNRDCKIFLVGRDEMQNGSSMKSYMQARLGKYADNIVFTGALERTRLKIIYAQSRVCVFPSLWENYPTVILEAMAAGCAVAASIVGGIPEIVQHQRTGILFHPKKSKQIAYAVNSLLQSEKNRSLLATQARECLKQTIGDNNFGSKLVTFYTRSIKNKFPTIV